MGIPISVDTKKKELVGDVKNAGRELRPKDDPEPVRVHDLIIPEFGKMVSYGVYDVTKNAGWVNVCMSHDTATFVLKSIRGWWIELSAACHSAATRLLINADRGGSNGVRIRLWKRELQALANELGIAISGAPSAEPPRVWREAERLLWSPAGEQLSLDPGTAHCGFLVA